MMTARTEYVLAYFVLTPQICRTSNSYESTIYYENLVFIPFLCFPFRSWCCGKTFKYSPTTGLHLCHRWKFLNLNSFRKNVDNKNYMSIQNFCYAKDKIQTKSPPRKDISYFVTNRHNTELKFNKKYQV